MTNQQSAKRAKPGDGALDNPAMAVLAQPAAVLVSTLPIVRAIRTRQDDAAGGESFAQRVAVVSAVGDEVFRLAPVRGDARLQRRVDERDFRGRRRGNGDSQRNTLTLDQYHAL